MEVCFINFNKGDDNLGCLKFCNILKWSATVYGKLLKCCLESIVRYDSIRVKDQYTLAKGPLNVDALDFSLSSL